MNQEQSRIEQIKQEKNHLLCVDRQSKRDIKTKL